jgi:benzoate/toluate 1,2-dioxygenase reductase subunit
MTPPVLRTHNPASPRQARLLNRRWLSETAFEIVLAKPPSFHFIPGQRICLSHEGGERDYSLVSAPDDEALTLCIKYVKEGRVSPFLAEATVGTTLHFTGPSGYFTHKPSPRPAVFVATGTGIAPFLSMSRAGLRGFTLLHGARSAGELYYEVFFRSVSGLYIPCVTEASEGEGVFRGRVTDYLDSMMPRKAYDFYLCGRGEMIRDATLLVDARFPDSLVYTETFY